MFKVGLSSCGKEIDEKLFSEYKKSGIGFMEISMSYEKLEEFDYKKTQKLAQKYGINLWSFHLPFERACYDISQLDEQKRSLCVKTLSELIKKAADIGIDKFVIHPSREPIEDEERNAKIEKSKQSLKELSCVAVASGGVLAVEDLPRTCLGNSSSELLELVLSDENLRICLDTNHMLMENPADLIRNVGKRIITTHISDYDFINERHWLPGEGKINWNEIVAALKEVNYNGVWLYEIGFKCPKTIIRDRDLVCDDFTRNAKEIFMGKDITVFSRHKENLGMWE